MSPQRNVLVLTCCLCKKDTTTYAKVFADNSFNKSTTSKEAFSTLIKILGTVFSANFLVICLKDLRALTRLLDKIKEVSRLYYLLVARAGQKKIMQQSI